MEPTPGIGLSQLIVDLVDPGRTLKANGLVMTETIADWNLGFRAMSVIGLPIGRSLKQTRSTARRWLFRACGGSYRHLEPNH